LKIRDFDHEGRDGGAFEPSDGRFGCSIAVVSQIALSV